MLQNITFLHRLGFNPIRFRFAVITACASIAALFIAQYLQLVHPQWAAMTVWASAQPWRENLLEKSWWRFAGTVIGVLVGVILIQLHIISPLLFIVGLALWLGACSGIGQLQKGFVAYGTFLAGYSAVMVSMLSVHMTDNLFMVAWDRLWTILVGVLSAVVFNFLFTPKREQEPVITLKNQVDTLFYQILHRTLEKKKPIKSQEIDQLWQVMTSYEEILETNRIGWHYHRKQVAKARQKLMFQSQILLHLDKYQSIAPFYFPAQEPADKEWKYILSLCPNGVLKMLLVPFYYATLGKSIKKINKTDKLKLHQDKISAWQSFTRSFVTIGAVGVLWFWTQWQMLAYLILGLSVMLALFASLDHPARFMKNIFTGQFFGAIAALICMWCLWPFTSSSWQMTFLIIPVIISGIVIFSHNRLILIAFDYIMVSLILLQPSYPFALSFPQSIGNAIAIVSGPLVAMAAFAWIYPTSPKKRYQQLIYLSEQQFKQGITALIQSHKPSTTQFIHRLFSGLLLAKKANFSPSPIFDFFITRQSIWLYLLILQKQFAHHASKKRALIALEKRIQQNRFDLKKISTLFRHLQRNESDNEELEQLEKYVKLYMKKEYCQK
ncbi:MULTISPECIES: FUSC family protein [Providencia]|uniref:FUSC family protein n=1 Tax=Providencia TaxID=586 RepID=UPI001CA656CA|nr:MULTISPECIES: FUSC family protein [Providencia]MCG9942013.1 FUSC family protein [Providencia rettgeri]MCL0020597.1 FUSC family protein [Providencia rettgeri]QZY64620.1 FUSC family protein [Providencia rettgeri]WOB82242.1 FUSC family protein [Providencia sp. PROV114]HEE8951623.1 FUSC family protein [Providencia rettgeri]